MKLTEEYEVSQRNISEEANVDYGPGYRGPDGPAPSDFKTEIPSILLSRREGGGEGGNS